MKRLLTCAFCEKAFEVWPYRLRRKDAKVSYCSQECYHSARVGIALSRAVHVGRDKWFLENEERYGFMENGTTRENNTNWKGDAVGYDGLHKRMRKDIGPAKCCAKCGISEGRIELSNISGTYRSDVEDWEYLCVKCHRIFDTYRVKIGVTYA